MQAALTATATTADGTSLLALAYHDHVLLYNTTTNKRISLTPSPSNTPSTAPSSSSSAAAAAADDDDDAEQPNDADDNDEAEQDDGTDEQRRPQKQAKGSPQPASAGMKPQRPLTTQDILQAQNTLTAFRVVVFSLDGRQLAIADDNKRLSLYDTSTGAVTHSHELPKRIITACFVPRTHSSHSTVYEMMVADKGGDIHRLKFSAGTSSVASADGAAGTSDSVTLSHLAIITSLSCSPAVAELPALLFSSDSDGHIRLSRHPTHYDIHSFLLSAIGVISTAVIPTSQLCISGGVGSDVTVWRYGEAGASQVLQRLAVDADRQVDEEAVQFIGQLVYDSRTSLLFVLSYPSSTVRTFSLSHDPSTASLPLSVLPSTIVLESGQPSALSVDAAGRVYILTDDARVWMYVRAEDGTWQADGSARQLSEQVKAELTDVVEQERREAEAKAGSAVSVAPVWSIGMTVHARWREKQKRERQMHEKQAQLAEQKANKKRKQ